MKTVYVLRHAESSSDDPTLPDHARLLAPRGLRATAALAAHIRRRRVRPDAVLCSSACRARQTLDGIAGALGDGWQLLVEDELYGAEAGALMARLRRLDGAIGSVLLVGHNPGLQTLVMALSGDGEDDALASVGQKFPSAALATLSLPGPVWTRIAPGVGYLESIYVPRDRRP